MQDLNMFQMQHLVGEHAPFVPDLGSEGVFTNSSSPSLDEPRTPVSQGGWEEDIGLVSLPYGFDDMARFEG